MLNNLTLLCSAAVYGFAVALLRWGRYSWLGAVLGALAAPLLFIIGSSFLILIASHLVARLGVSEEALPQDTLAAVVILGSAALAIGGSVWIALRRRCRSS